MQDAAREWAIFSAMAWRSDEFGFRRQSEPGSGTRASEDPMSSLVVDFVMSLDVDGPADGRLGY
jgi:hypothetical protein